MKTILLASVPVLLAGMIILGLPKCLSGRANRIHSGHPAMTSRQVSSYFGMREPGHNGDPVIKDKENKFLTKNIIVCIL